MVACETLNVRATSACASPAMRRCSASWRWCGVILRGRPNRTPRSLARLRPSPVLARISSRSQTQARKVARELLKRADTIVKHAQTRTTRLEWARFGKGSRASPPALLTLARVRLQRLSPIGNCRNRPARAENAANFFRSSAKTRVFSAASVTAHECLLNATVDRAKELRLLANDQPPPDPSL